MPKPSETELTPPASAPAHGAFRPGRLTPVSRVNAINAPLSWLAAPCLCVVPGLSQTAVLTYHYRFYRALELP